MDNLKELTIGMKAQLDILNNKFVRGNKDLVERSKEFFDYVKEDSAEYFKGLDVWYKEAVDFVQKHKGTLYEMQIKATKENVELLILHSYYIDVRKRRYIELKRSCIYVYDQLLKEIDVYEGKTD